LIADKEENKNQNVPEKNYYWQTFVITTVLFIVFILILVTFGVLGDGNTGSGFYIFYLLLFYLVNIVLKKFIKKHGDDLLS